MFEEIKVRITGVSPLLMHNLRSFMGVNSSAEKDRFTELTKKKGKTEADIAEMQRLEWHLGLILGKDGQPCVPGEHIEAAMAQGSGRGNKKKFQAAVMCDGEFVVKHGGPKTIDGLWKDGNYADVRPVVIQRQRINRTRPRFNTWSVDATVKYLPGMVNRNDVVKALETAGQVNGIGDFRPKFGRFNVEVLD